MYITNLKFHHVALPKKCIHVQTAIWFDFIYIQFIVPVFLPQFTLRVAMQSSTINEKPTGYSIKKDKAQNALKKICFNSLYIKLFIVFSNPTPD